MKVSRSFKKVAKLVTAIKDAKNEAKTVISDIKKERTSLDTLEEQAKAVQKM